MSLVIDSGFNYDADASAYIDAVEAADGQALETATRYAINDFVIGCKQDGIWSAIKASCILAGARTLAGALKPLVGTAPTNPGNVFVQADYNRKTGLKGNSSTKYLNSNIKANSLTQNSVHLAAYKGVAETTYKTFIGTVASPALLIDLINIGSSGFRSLLNNNSGSGYDTTVSTSGSGFYGAARLSSSNVLHIADKTIKSFTYSSAAPNSDDLYVFARNGAGTPQEFSAHRLSFYSIGESLDLALLDARVTALMSAFAAAIP
mgnify:CR=1 FL=1